MSSPIRDAARAIAWAVVVGCVLGACARWVMHYEMRDVVRKPIGGVR